jgi:hypothetical protein
MLFGELDKKDGVLMSRLQAGKCCVLLPQVVNYRRDADKS